MENKDRKRINWAWLLLIALFAVVLVFVMANPSGDTPSEEPTPDVDLVAPVEVPETSVDEMAKPDDDTMVTRIDDETAAEAAVPPD
ncbi:MAG: hypothetical protein JJ901_03655 [Erythrobacter sp.]|uniref:hypothetical protein n=1 Tax=Erythrobacter sp. TaxID=1042 RepID=UPI001B1F0200|nr:hypothetical protein [Erythrobacter sp.]MBO6730958.1 hypothetical protein [Maricaulis sp.]MBO6767386.1 hypothetical protein [Erythrobacter sp.]